MAKIPTSEAKTRTSRPPVRPTSSGVNVGSIPVAAKGNKTGGSGSQATSQSKAGNMRGPGGVADNRARPTDTGKNPRRPGPLNPGANSSRHVPNGARQVGGGYGAS